jgi:hypothetical protein
VNLLGALAHRELGDIRSANRSAERALALAEPERLVLPFAMTGLGELLEALPRHDTAHAALLADILDVLHGSTLTVGDHPVAPPTEQLTASELRVLRYLPTNLSRPEIASQLSVSVNTATHMSATSTPSSRPATGPRPCSALAIFGYCPPARRGSARSPDPGEEHSPDRPRPWLHVGDGDRICLLREEAS